MSVLLLKRVNPLLILAALLLAAFASSCCCMGGLDDEELILNKPESNPIPPVAVVSADPNHGVEPMEVQLDATESYDTDGTIVQYDWDFDGDGTWDMMDGGATPTHMYQSSGGSSVSFVQTAVFSPKVRVTDNDGLTDEATTTVTIGELIPPVAVVSADPANGLEPLEVQLDATASHDDDGTIVQYDWDFDGDGTYDMMDGGATPTHTYDSSSSSSVSFVETGTFNPTVRVTDNDGLTDEASTKVTIGELVPPTASLVPTPDTGDAPLDVTWDASGSSDSDGTIVQYDWDMDNDGTYEITDGGDSQSVNYDPGGIYTVGVRVTDNDGLTDETTASVDVNNPPVADLVPIPDSGDAPLDVHWDASGSTDSDGTIVQYDWDMDNDGTFEITDGGDSQDASYPTFGAYTVGVRVTDDDGATDETTASVNANEPPVADLVPIPDSGVVPLTVVWDASGSTDADGTIVQYDWDMDNDGTFEITDGGDSQNATYPDFGSYTVGVRVTDDDGATDSTTATAVAMVPPVADLQAEPDTGTAPIDITWHAEGSTDADGTVVQWDWDMDNDGTYELIDSTSTQDVNYANGGMITVGVRVTDNDGLTDSTTLTIDINDPPTAMLTNTFEPITEQEYFIIHWDASASFDTDGTIVQYDWDLDNDGTFETIAGGPFQDMDYFDWSFMTDPIVGVRVTDDDGAQDETYANALIPPVGIVVPDIDNYPAPVDVTWDASTSWDPDGGPIVQYDWDLDGNGSWDLIDGGPTQVIHYEDNGFYNVRVRVIDDDGQEGIAYGSIYLHPPA